MNKEYTAKTIESTIEVIANDLDYISEPDDWDCICLATKYSNELEEYYAEDNWRIEAAENMVYYAIYNQDEPETKMSLFYYKDENGYNFDWTNGMDKWTVREVLVYLNNRAEEDDDND